LFYKIATINWNARTSYKDPKRDRKSITNKEEFQKNLIKENQEKKETFYNTTSACKTTDLKKARASVFSCDLQSNHQPIYVNSEENLMISPYKTLVTSNCVLTTNYSDNHNHIKEEDFLMTSPNNKEINIDRLNTNDQEPDILDSIKSIGNIIGTNIAKANLKNDDVTRLTELNSKLNNIEIRNENYDDGKEYKNSRLNSYIND